MSDDLVTWLRAQLDEDERAARAWMPLGNPTDADRDHVARVDPGRVLAEVDAKRRILDQYERAIARRKAHPDDLASAGALLGLVPTVKILALPYADRPGYRDEWRP